MNAQTNELLDAALGVFLRYGYRRTTMGDIAKAAMMSRPSLYARFANKDEVYGAVFSLHIDRMLEALEQAWDGCETLSDRLDAVWAICILPVFDLLNDHPDASDIIDGADTPAGKEALDRATQRVVATFTRALRPFEEAIGHHGQTPEQLARFIDLNKQMMIKMAQDRKDLEQQFATLKTAVLCLCDA